MKTIIAFMMMLSLSEVVPHSANAGGNAERTLTGAAIGAGVGALVAHNSDHISGRTAIATGAFAGAVIGNKWHHGYVRRNYGYWIAAPFLACAVDRYAESRYYYDPPGERFVYLEPAMTPSPATAQQQATRPGQTIYDPQPGVDLIKVSIRHSNGMTTDLPILRIGENRFVGPQGEEYNSLPTAKQLAEKYSM